MWLSIANRLTANSIWIFFLLHLSSISNPGGSITHLDRIEHFADIASARHNRAQRREWADNENKNLKKNIVGESLSTFNE